MLLSLKCRLPVEKNFSFILCPWKGFRTHVSKIIQLFSNSIFLCGHKPKMIFGQTTHVESDQMCKFHRFCPARCACNNVAHGITSRDKLQNVFSSFTDKIWTLQLKYFSYQRDLRRPFSSTFIGILKVHQFTWKNSQNAGVNRAKKAYQCIVYTPMILLSRIEVRTELFCCYPSVSKSAYLENLLTCKVRLL